MGIYRAPKIKMPKSEIDLSYLAAVVDCEGFIGTLKAHTPQRPYWAVGVANTDKPLIEWVASIGGGVSIHPARDGALEKFDWWLRARADVFVFLSTLEPFLRIKRHRALSALDDYLRFFGMHFGKDLTREEVMARLPELLAYEHKA